MSERAINIEDTRKRENIIHADYKFYPQPLRQLLEYRQEAYKRIDINQESEDYKTLIDYVETEIKMILDL